MKLYDSFLSVQSEIEKLNQTRPKIYIYTDFGGGKNGGALLADLQTSGEIASAAWKSTLQQLLYINDSAAPLSPERAAGRLLATFPCGAARDLHTIVVHVIDPGVGNGQEAQPRAAILRRDGVLFIGPDNGTLSGCCPTGSIMGAWEISPEVLNSLSGADVAAGGTFHGRDLFVEAALRVAAGELCPEDLGKAYSQLELKNRIQPLDGEPLAFEMLSTERSLFGGDLPLFDTAFLLGVIQSPLVPSAEVSLTHAKKWTFVNGAPCIAISNRKTGNIYVGPDNGLGTSFFQGFQPEEIETFSISKATLQEIEAEKNNEKAYALLQRQPRYSQPLQEIDFLGEPALQGGRPLRATARIWIDRYGNLKTTLKSRWLNEARKAGVKIRVRLNGVENEAIFADSFSQVGPGRLFVYNGSSGSLGPNPHRSSRYVELTANGVHGKFGVDFFENGGAKPVSGDKIEFWFN